MATIRVLLNSFLNHLKAFIDWKVLNNMWIFDLDTNEWAWISGNSTTSVVSSYGSKGVSSRANYPGGRVGASMVNYPKRNAVLIFGGYRSWYGKLATLHLHVSILND